jgi:hypothetical protein
VVNAAVHESETVGWTDDRIDRQIEDRAVVNRHVRQITAVPLPCSGEIVFDSSENDLQIALRAGELLSIATGAGTILPAPARDFLAPARYGHAGT